MKRARKAERRAELEAQLECPPLPLELAYVWRTWHRLSNRRGSNGFDLNPIGWGDIDAFVRLSGLRLRPWEIALIEMLDDSFRAERAKALKAKTGKTEGR